MGPASGEHVREHQRPLQRERLESVHDVVEEALIRREGDGHGRRRLHDVRPHVATDVVPHLCVELHRLARINFGDGRVRSHELRPHVFMHAEVGLVHVNVDRVRHRTRRPDRRVARVVGHVEVGAPFEALRALCVRADDERAILKQGRADQAGAAVEITAGRLRLRLRRFVRVGRLSRVLDASSLAYTRRGP